MKPCPKAGRRNEVILTLAMMIAPAHMRTNYNEIVPQRKLLSNSTQRSVNT